VLPGLWSQRRSESYFYDTEVLARYLDLVDKIIP